MLVMLNKVLPGFMKKFIKSYIRPIITCTHIIYFFFFGKRQLDAILNSTTFKGIIIYPPTIDWNWMKQRPHHLLREMAKQGYLIFFCSPQSKTDFYWGFEKIDENLFLCGSLEYLKNIPSTILLITSIDHFSLISQFNNPCIIYDYLDSITVSGEGQSEDKLKKHNLLLESADIITATASVLYEEAKKVRPDVIMLPNAVNLDDFWLNQTPHIPSDIGDIVKQNKPIIGYYGALARWVDFNLITKVASLRPDYNFILIGPDYDGSMEKELEIKDNIFWLGQKKYEELPAYLYYYDVAIIAFKISDISVSTSPVKLFEYFAGGKPVVTTEMNECKNYSTVLIGKDATDFAAKLDEALELRINDKFLNDVMRLALDNTWQSRAVTLSSVLQKVFETKE